MLRTKNHLMMRLLICLTKRVILFIGLSLLVTHAVFAQKITLEPENTIIIFEPVDALRMGSGYLQIALRKIYGTDKGFERYGSNDLRKLQPDDLTKKTVFALGNTRLSKHLPESELGTYGFAITKNKNVITIVGSQAEGAKYGVAHFLDTFLGVRHYLPGDLFIGVAKKGKITLEDKINIRQKPFTEYVMTTGIINAENFKEYNWARFTGLLRKDWESHQHSMYARFPPSTFAEKYPEIYPVVNGKRYIPQSAKDQKWQPDFAEPHLVDAAVESAVEYFKKHPKIDHISFSVQDSRNFSSEGKLGEALRKSADASGKPTLTYTDLYVKFINQIAERLEKELPKQGIPGKKTIVYLGYSNVNRVPAEKLHPNVLPISVFRVAEINMKGSLLSGNGNNPSSVADWLTKTKRFGYHDWAQGNGYLFPRIYSGLHANLVKFIHDKNAALEYAHIEAYPNWGLDGPKLYIMSRLLWNPDLDPKQLLAQFCADMFGKASNEMKNYFTTLEQLTVSMNNNPKRMRKLSVYPQQLLLDEKELAMVKQARTHLDKAAKMVKDGDEKKRLDLFSNSFRLSEYLFEVANAKQVTKQRVEEIKRYAREVVGNDPMTFYVARYQGLPQTVESAIRKSVGNRLVDTPQLDGKGAGAAAKPK